MENSDPMYIPVQQRYLSNTRSLDEDVQSMSVDEMKHLLIMMGTITVISFILVVSIVTILAAFVWYSRRRMRSTKCTCTTTTDDQWNCIEEARSLPPPAVPTAGLKTAINNKDVFINTGYVYPASVGGSYVNPLMPLYAAGSGVTAAVGGRFMEADTWSQDGSVCGGGSSIRSSRRFVAPPVAGAANTVIVNPLPPLPPLQGVRNNNSQTTSSMLHPHLYAKDPAMMREMVNCDKLETEDASTDPIYQEIGAAAVKEKIAAAERQEASVENQGKNVNSSHETEGANDDTNIKSSPSNSQKKEIEYWQITAKEVVKFRPCTETFIHRNNV